MIARRTTRHASASKRGKNTFPSSREGEFFVCVVSVSDWNSGFGLRKLVSLEFGYVFETLVTSFQSVFVLRDVEKMIPWNPEGNIGPSVRT